MLVHIKTSAHGKLRQDSQETGADSLRCTAAPRLSGAHLCSWHSTGRGRWIFVNLRLACLHNEFKASQV